MMHERTRTLSVPEETVDPGGSTRKCIPNKPQSKLRIETQLAYQFWGTRERNCSMVTSSVAMNNRALEKYSRWDTLRDRRNVKMRKTFVS